MLPIAFEKSIVVQNNVLVSDMDNELVLLDINTDTYYSLDSVGASIWRNLTSDDSVNDAYSHLLEEYDVEPERLRLDLQNLISTLIENKLVTLE